MSKLLILTRYPSEFEPTRLKAEAEKQNLKVTILSYKRVDKVNLSDFKYVIPRSASKPGDSLVSVKTEIIKSLKPNQVCLNQETFSKYPLTSKVFQAQLFSQKNLPIIPSWVFTDIKKATDFLKKQTSFPLIAKGAFGSHGREVFVIKSKKEGLEIIKERGWDKVIFQPLVNSPFWLRSLVLKGKFLGWVKRKTKSRFLPRYEKDLKQELKKEEEEIIKQISLKATKALSADFVGLDFLFFQDQWSLLEANRTPQFKIFEKKTGINVAEKIITTILP